MFLKPSSFPSRKLLNIALNIGFQKACDLLTSDSFYMILPSNWNIKKEIPQGRQNLTECCMSGPRRWYLQTPLTNKKYRTRYFLLAPLYWCKDIWGCVSVKKSKFPDHPVSTFSKISTGLPSRNFTEKCVKLSSCFLSIKCRSLIRQSSQKQDI